MSGAPLVGALVSARNQYTFQKLEINVIEHLDNSVQDQLRSYSQGTRTKPRHSRQRHKDKEHEQLNYPHQLV